MFITDVENKKARQKCNSQWKYKSQQKSKAKWKCQSHWLGTENAHQWWKVREGWAKV